jgi:hypothetical protein
MISTDRKSQKFEIYKCLIYIYRLPSSKQFTLLKAVKIIDEVWCHAAVPSWVITLREGVILQLAVELRLCQSFVLDN